MKTLSEKTLATEELEDFSVMTVNIHGDKYCKDKDGKFHREDGPAIEYSNGNKYWFQHGKYHREDGPAFESTKGDKVWYQHGKCHREEGSAIEYADGSKSWYLNGKEVSEADVRALGKMKD